MKTLTVVTYKCGPINHVFLGCERQHWFCHVTFCLLYFLFIILKVGLFWIKVEFAKFPFDVYIACVCVCVCVLMHVYVCVCVCGGDCLFWVSADKLLHSESDSSESRWMITIKHTLSVKLGASWYVIRDQRQYIDIIFIYCLQCD